MVLRPRESRSPPLSVELRSSAALLFFVYIYMECYGLDGWWRWSRLILCMCRFVLSFCKGGLTCKWLFVRFLWKYQSKMLLVLCVLRNFATQKWEWSSLSHSLLWQMLWFYGCFGCLFYGLWRFIRLWTERGLMSPLSLVFQCTEPLKEASYIYEHLKYPKPPS